MPRWLATTALLAFLAGSGIAKECPEQDLERLTCSVSDKATVHVHLSNDANIDTAVLFPVMRVVRESLKASQINLVYWSEVPEFTDERPDNIRISYLTTQQFAPLYRKEDAQNPPEKYYGFTLLKDHHGLVHIDTIAADSPCRQEQVTLLANVTLHEIGHLLGLAHAGTQEVEGSDIAVNFPGDKWNIMNQGKSWENACGGDTASLHAIDMPFLFDEKQGRMMRSAATGGVVWQRMVDAQYSYPRYLAELRKAVEARPDYYKKAITGTHPSSKNR